MQYVNDDMDELFRKAAENYPLKTNSADWTKIVAAMQNKNETKIISGKKRNKTGRFLWLLLLLPFGLICHRLNSPGNLKGNGISTTKNEKENLFSAKKNIGKNQSEKNNSVTNNNNKLTEVNASPANTKSETKNPVDPYLQVQKTYYFSKAGLLKIKDQRYNNYNDEMSNPPFNDLSLNEENSFSRNYVSEIAFHKIHASQSKTVVNRTLTPLISSTHQSSNQNLRMERRKKFYVGGISGMDATTVKFQKIENAGLTYGVLAGYQFNKRWSVEAAAFVETKYYYSDGKYFNTSKIYLPPNSRIDNVSGGCKMIELPVSVKYNFVVRKKSSWFSTLGVSSYIMKRENYTYNYYFGSVGPVAYKKEYKNFSTNLFSHISISGGYVHELGNFADLRIEPYLKLPVSGVGIGSLPLFSAGLQMGLIKKF